jgi:hypothetical protein
MYIRPTGISCKLFDRHGIAPALMYIYMRVYIRIICTYIVRIRRLGPGKL